MLLMLLPMIWSQCTLTGAEPLSQQRLGSAFTSSSFAADKAMQVVYKHPTLWSIGQLPSGPRIVSICCVLQWNDSGNFLSSHRCHASHWLNSPRWLQRCPKLEIQTKATLPKQTRMCVCCLHPAICWYAMWVQAWAGSFSCSLQTSAIGMSLLPERWITHWMMELWVLFVGIWFLAGVFSHNRAAGLVD